MKNQEFLMSTSKYKQTLSLVVALFCFVGVVHAENEQGGPKTGFKTSVPATVTVITRDQLGDIQREIADCIEQGLPIDCSDFVTIEPIDERELDIQPKESE